MCRKQVKDPMTALISRQGSGGSSNRQHANRGKRLPWGKQPSWSDRQMERSYGFVLATGAISLGRVTLELHGATAFRRL